LETKRWLNEFFPQPSWGFARIVVPLQPQKEGVRLLSILKFETTNLN
jgi:hypothetical protein